MKIKELTRRSHNLDAEVVMKVNRVIREPYDTLPPPSLPASGSSTNWTAGSGCGFGV